MFITELTKVVVVLDATVANHTLNKTIEMTASGQLSVHYDLTLPPSSGPLLFASEVDFSLLTPETAGGRRLVMLEPETEVDPRPGARLEHDDVRALRIDGGDMGFAIRIDVAAGASLWRVPIETVSQSERGFESAYQGTALLFVWRVEAGAEHVQCDLKLTLEPTSS